MCIHWNKLEHLICPLTIGIKRETVSRKKVQQVGIDTANPGPFPPITYIYIEDHTSKHIIPYTHGTFHVVCATLNNSPYTHQV